MKDPQEYFAEQATNRLVDVTKSAAKQYAITQVMAMKRLPIIRALFEAGIILTFLTDSRQGYDEDEIEQAILDMAFDCYLDREIKSEQLPLIHALFGKCTVDEDSKQVHRVAENTIRVNLEIGDDEAWSGMNFYIVRKLEENSPCKIKTITTTRQELMCEKPE